MKLLFSEYNCDRPIIEHSVENISECITKKAGKKYHYANIDLFIFITETEYDCLIALLHHSKYNSAMHKFTSIIESSPFKIIYLCVWNLYKNDYNVNDPYFVKITNSIEMTITITIP